MKARLLVDQEIRNPAWNEASAAAAKSAGVEYDVPAFVPVAAGFVLEGDDCWIHCCPGDLNAPPIAEPVCDACTDAVRHWMEVKRPKAIAEIRNAFENLGSFKNKQDKERVIALARAYGITGGGDAASAAVIAKGKAKQPAAE